MKDVHGLRLRKLGELIKRERHSKNYTQQALSELIDIDIRTLQRIEQGQLNISINIFISLVNALNIDATEVIKKISDTTLEH